MGLDKSTHGNKKWKKTGSLQKRKEISSCWKKAEAIAKYTGNTNYIDVPLLSYD